MKPELTQIENRLCLSVPDGKPIYVDFDAIIEARCKPGVKKPDILRACKLTPEMHVLDATAGLGRDAAVLASTGAKVTLCERHPILQALLKDGLKRLDSKLNLTLQPMDAKQYLNHAKDYPDVIYLDPMHPSRSKSASVKKDLKALQNLIGPDDDVLELITLARKYAKKRVVLKWPQKQKPLLAPDYSVQGKTIRFDVFN